MNGRAILRGALVILLFSLAESPVAQGATITVGYGPGYDFGTIQAAIDAAAHGDTVIVTPGTYTGPGNRDIDFGGRAITVRSIDPNDASVAETTIIYCQHSWENVDLRGFHFHSGQDGNSVLEGLTIMNGLAWSENGGAIVTENSSPTIRNCIIRDNSAEAHWGHGGFGGAISCEDNSSPTIIGCSIILSRSRIVFWRTK
jgi:hypothetical protein